MPIAKIHVQEGRYDAAGLDAISDAIHHAIVDTLGVPVDDFYQIIHVLPRSQYRHTRSYMGLQYSDDMILLEITFLAGRPKEKRLALIKALNEALVAKADLSSDDLVILFYELPPENVSFGRGIAQRATQ